MLVVREDTIRMAAQKKPLTFPDDYLKYDTQGALKVLLALPDQIRESYRLADGVRPARQFKRIAVVGMGGSGVAGDLLKMFLESEGSGLPVVCSKGYDAPPVDAETLLFAVSYSGNTEETLAAYKMALRSGCQAITLSSGGKLADLAKVNKHAHVLLPPGLQPRMAVAYVFFPLLRILEQAGVVRKLEDEVRVLSESLRKQDLRPNAIELSGKCFERIPIIWSDSSFEAVAYLWKTQINENAKSLSFYHTFPELDHNEILSFSNRTGPCQVVILSSDRFHRRVAKRITLTKDVVQRKGVPVTEIGLRGPVLKQMFTAIMLGELVSYYLALRYETDPTPVAIIEQFKKDMGPFLV